MARECELCHKRVEVGYQYAYRGLAKAKGGVGIKVTGKTKRKFRPNLQRVRATVDGTVRRVRVCTRCIKSGKLEKPHHRKAMELLTRAASSGASSAGTPAG